MALARRSHSPPQDDDHLDRVFRALADRTRRAIMARLAEGPAKVTELAEPFAMSLPAVSKHLKKLERAGLIARAIDGRVHRCSLSAEPLRDVEAWLAHYRVYWQDALSLLAQYTENAETVDG